MPEIMVLRVGFLITRMGGIFNSICQQTKINNLKLLVNDRYVKTITWRDISTNKFLLTEKLKPHETFVDKKGNLVKKKGKDSPKIAVIKLDGSRTSMYLKEAEKMAKIKRLELVEVGVVAEKKLYKLSEIIESESVETKEKTKTKKIIIKSSILEHDLIIKINAVNKLLKKKNEVLIEIIKNDTEASTNMEMIEKKIRDGICGDCKIVTSSSSNNNKRRLHIILNESDEQNSNTDKSTEEIEVKSKTHENDKSKTNGKKS